MSSSEIEPTEIDSADTSPLADKEDENAREPSVEEPVQQEISGNVSIQAAEPARHEKELITETRLLRDTLDLLWNQTAEQRKMCQQLEQENEYLQEYISNLMTSSNVLDK